MRPPRRTSRVQLADLPVSCIRVPAEVVPDSRVSQGDRVYTVRAPLPPTLTPLGVTLVSVAPWHVRKEVEDWNQGKTGPQAAAIKR